MAAPVTTSGDATHGAGAPGLTTIVLGAGAGGGFPQWNCGCALCQRARAGDPRAPARSQASAVFSADRRQWLVVGASPDLRQQILATPALSPAPGTRDSPIAAVALVSADVDGIAGLLVLRERHRFRLFAPAPILEILRGNTVFDVLDPALVERVALPPLTPMAVAPGLDLTLLPMPGKVPLYLEDRASAQPAPGPAYAALVRANGRSAVFAPACAEVTPEVLERLRPADLVLFDGTMFTDDEMVHAGMGAKTARRMGHVPMSGPDGSLARLASLPGRRVFVHINNTNPVLLAESAERRAVERAGFEIGEDGMEIVL